MRLHTRIARLEANAPPSWDLEPTPEEKARAKELLVNGELTEEGRAMVAKARETLLAQIARGKR